MNTRGEFQSRNSPQISKNAIINQKLNKIIKSYIEWIDKIEDI